MKDEHHYILYTGIVISSIGFLLVLASLILENYVYRKEVEEEQYRHERILLMTIGEICIFIGFACINGSIVYKMKKNGHWE
jgi:tellurite resistance protein TehA-like permease